MMSELNERLRSQLGIQALQIQAAFDRLGQPAAVRGGRVSEGCVAYYLRTGLELSAEQLSRVGQMLATTFGRGGFSLGLEGGGLRLRLSRRQADWLPLLDLMELFGERPQPRIVLGLDYAERPVCVDLLAGRSANILVAGGPGSGKTSLIRSAAISAAWQSAQGELQLVLIDARAERERAAVSELLPLARLPHMQFPVVTHPDEAIEILEFLAGEADYRQEQGFERPLVLVNIDNVDGLLAVAGARAAGPLGALLENGRRVGIRTLLAATDISREPLHWLIRHNTDLRLVGQVSTREEARLATGRPDSQAEYLQKPGDFLAVRGQQLIPFQAAYLDDYDLYYTLQALARPKMPALFARPYPPGGEGDAGEEDEFITFEVDGQTGEVRPADDASQAGAAVIVDAGEKDGPEAAAGEPAAEPLPFEWSRSDSTPDESEPDTWPARKAEAAANGGRRTQEPAKPTAGRVNGRGRVGPRSEPAAKGELVYEQDDDFVDWVEPEH